MEQKTRSQKFLRQRKFLVVLPLLVIPFLTLLFWLLGGGKANGADAKQAQNGLNMQLPNASLKEDKTLDKLSYYEKAASDSLKMQQLMENDPFYQQHKELTTPALPNVDTSIKGIKTGSNTVTSGNSRLNHNITYEDPNEAKVYQKLAQLDNALNKASATSQSNQENINIVKPTSGTSVNSNDINRMEQMMQGMNQKSGDDPEIGQLNGMLEKILDIQHPDRVREKIKQTSETKKGQVFAVAVGNENNSISLLDNKGTKNYGINTNRNSFTLSNNFYSLDDETLSDDNQNSIRAVIHETQNLVNGSTVKLRLLNDIFINGVLIPKGNFLFGIADLNGERLGIKISSIRYHNSLFPVDLSVCDIDGMDGIYIPGAITRDVAKQSLDRASQSIDFTTLNPSIGAQAVNTGIEAAKTLLGRKAKLIKITVKAGYQVLLRDEKQKQDNR